MNNPWLPQKHRILNIIEETDLESTFVVEFRDPQIRHGQFFQLSLPKIGEAPISVSSFTDSTQGMISISAVPMATAFRWRNSRENTLLLSPEVPACPRCAVPCIII